MKTNLVLRVILVLAFSFLCGCGSTPKRDLSKIQGTWVGREIGGPTGECRMTIAGDSLKFQGARSEEWYAAKLVLKPNPNPRQVDVLIEDCPAPQYIRKTARGIYKLEGKTLTIAANEPGDKSLPGGFERNATSRARVFEFNRK